MKMLRRTVIVLCAVSPLSLAACGEGYEVVKIRGTAPYTEERTAGPGVAYVRAHLMPEKTIVLPAPLVAPAINDAEPIFEQKVQKK